MRCRPMCASRIRSRRRSRDADWSSIWSASCSSEAASVSTPCRPKAREAVAPRGRCRGRAACSCLGHRRRRKFAVALRALESGGRTGWCSRRSPKRSSCGRPSCSAPRTISSIASRRSPASSPALPLPGGGHMRFQPVFAGDVAEAIAKAVDGDAKPGTIYELGGPDIRTFKELMEFMLATDRAPAPARAGAVPADEAASGISAIPAQAAAHARSGRTAQNRQRRLSGGRA